MPPSLSRIDPDRLALFERLHLQRGSHRAPPPDCGDPELCAVETYRWLRREPHTDKHPSKVLGTFMRSWNDGLPDEQRDLLLKPLVVEIAQADLDVSGAAEQARGLMVADWYCREYTPTWLELAELDAHSAALRAFRPLLTWDDVAAIEPLLRSARDAARDAGDAAWAAWAAGAARDAWTAGAARDAAWAAARDAGDAAWAAWAAWAAGAAGAAWAARDAAWAAAQAAARDALAPTVAKLQQSALALVRRMSSVGGAS